MTEDIVESFLAPLPVRIMLWVGEKTGIRLNELGIRTIGDLASCDPSVPVEKFGVMGTRYHQYAHGVYKSEVGGKRGMRKSVGHESTFAADTNGYNVILQRLFDLCRRTHERTVRQNLLFKTVTVKIGYQNFRTHTHGKTSLFYESSCESAESSPRICSRLSFWK